MPTLDPSVTVERQLLVQLRPDQLAERSARMAAAELRIEVLEQERGAVGTKIKAQKEERKRLARVIECEHEEQAVPCRWLPDYDAKLWRLMRQDTGAEVETLAMSAADLQTTTEHLLAPDTPPTPAKRNHQPRA